MSNPNKLPPGWLLCNGCGSQYDSDVLDNCGVCYPNYVGILPTITPVNVNKALFSRCWNCNVMHQNGVYCEPCWVKMNAKVQPQTTLIKKDSGCECGAHAVGVKQHSAWCALNGKE